MDKDRQDELFAKFFTQLQNFADQHSLKFAASSYDVGKGTFIAKMDGDGFQIIIECPRSVPGEIDPQFSIHIDGNGDPTATSQQTLDQLFSDLKSFLGKMPNVTIKEHL